MNYEIDSIDYEKSSGKRLTEQDVLVVLNGYLNNLKIAATDSPKFSTFAPGNIKEYKISNKQIKSLVANAGLNRGLWAVLTAVAKIWKKNPTILTAMIVVIPAFGVVVINKCNSKGVIIKRITLGATSSCSCRSQ
ncbi:hypothetical protein J6TS2_32990 [Heyndrickxia sporothermodurans]|nr:hypothetical protein J6TS2_32990 [Heyndrickxia sporothermodurans]